MNEAWADGEPVIAETTWTKPSENCPHPDRWHTTGNGMATEFEVIQAIAGLVTAIQPDFVVETGGHLGLTSRAIGQALADNGHGRLVSLEIDSLCVQAARQRCQGLPVDIVEGDSMTYVPEEPIDFAWFDSEVMLRTSEFQRYLPSMHSRTIVGFHDTGADPHNSYLNSLVDAGLVSWPLYLPTPRGVAFARVLGA